MEIKENIAYWCQTEELAKKFLQECEKQKIRWHNGEKLIKTNWKDYKENTCYRIYLNPNKIKVVSYENKRFYEDNNIEIIEFKGEQKMDKEEIQAEIKAIQERLNILSSELEKCENEPILSIWRPEYNETYYYIGANCKVCSKTNYDSDFDNILFDCGNAFKTSEETEFEAQREKYTRLYRKYIKEHNTGFDGNIKFYAFWNCDDKEIGIGHSYSLIQGFGIEGSNEKVKQANSSTTSTRQA